jgi:hypothetical protein
MARQPYYEEETPGGYVDGYFRSPVYTARGERVYRLFRKTSKADLWVIALQLAIRMTGNEDQDEALSIIEAEKLVCQQNGLI